MSKFISKENQVDLNAFYLDKSMFEHQKNNDLWAFLMGNNIDMVLHADLVKKKKDIQR